MSRSRAGGERGSDYLQAFSTFMRENYETRHVQDIYLMVKQYMIQKTKVHTVQDNLVRTQVEETEATDLIQFTSDNTNSSMHSRAT